MNILKFPSWLLRDNSVQQAPEIPFKPEPSVIRRYAQDIERYGTPLDSGLPSYFREVADYYEKKEASDGN